MKINECRKKKLKIALSITIPISIIITCVLVSIPFIYFCYTLPKDRREELNYYQDDSNYHTYVAIISNYDLNIVGKNGREKISLSLYFDGVTGVDTNNTYTNVTLGVYSSDLKRVFGKIDQPTNKEITFMSPMIKRIGPGYLPAIVQITYEDEEILSFEDGKAALLAHYSD